MTLGVVGLTLTLLIGTRLSPDLVLIGAITLLLLLGILTPTQALEGLGNEGLVTVGVLFVVAAGLRDTGVVHAIGALLLGRPRSLTLAQVRLIAPVIAISAFINNTPLVAMLVPVVEDWARRCRFSVSKMMLPLSYAAILGGTCTLIGTSTNLIVHGLVLENTTLGPMGFFEIGALGLPVALAGFAFIILTSRWLLPDRKPPLMQPDEGREYTLEMLVEATSPLIGQTVEDAGLRHLPGAFLAEIERGDTILPAIAPTVRLQAGDRLLFVGVVDSVVDLVRMRGLVPAPEQLFKLDEPRADRRLFEVVVSDRSPIMNKTIRAGRFRTLYDAVVIAAARNGERLGGKLGDIEIRPGDTLLIESRSSFLDHHRNSRDFLLVSEVRGASVPRHDRAWIAAGIMALMVASATFGLLSMLESSLVAAGLMLATRCLTLDSARSNIDWSILVVIGAALGLGQALHLSGASSAIAQLWIGLADHDPFLTLVAVYILTGMLTNVITNNAAAVLAFPIAQAAAADLGVSMWPFIAVIMMGASASFATPIGYQTNLMVYGPGGYRFSDYLRLGVPLTLVLGIIVVCLAPLIWPFHPAAP